MSDLSVAGFNETESVPQKIRGTDTATLGDLQYPTTGGATDEVLTKTGEGVVGFTRQKSVSHFELRNATGTYTLPTAVGKNKEVYAVKANLTTGILTVDTTGSEKIDNEDNFILQDTDAITVISDGANWWII